MADLKDIRVSQRDQRSFVRICPIEATRVMHHQIAMKVTTLMRQKISQAAASSKMKQAEWLRRAAEEKLQRENPSWLA